MCLGVFLASDRSLSERPHVADSRTLSVAHLKARHEPVRQHLGPAHVYYLGAHTGCGCGFSPVWELDEDQRRRSVRALADYVAEAARRGAVELLVCWDDEAELQRGAGRRFRLPASELEREPDWLAEGTHVEVVAPPANVR